MPGGMPSVWFRVAPRPLIAIELSIAPACRMPGLVFRQMSENLVEL